MNNAERNRGIGIGMLIALYLPEAQEYDLTYRHGPQFEPNREGMAENIRKLSQLGRTTRWQRAITNWAAMVAAAEDNRGLRWALLQGAVYAGHVIQ